MRRLCWLAADNTPKANVLAYGKGYVELKGQTIRVIPHVMNLESCARHCDVDAACTHWRRCAGVHYIFAARVTTGCLSLRHVVGPKCARWVPPPDGASAALACAVMRLGMSRGVFASHSLCS